MYSYKDHLGNIRLSYTDINQNNSNAVSLKITEENNYYPFGLLHKGYNSNPSPYGNSAAKSYKFGGKELQNDEIGGVALDWYDFGARNYEASLGRWFNPDPLSGEREWLSPYNFVQNNPLARIDPTGLIDEQYSENNFGMRTYYGGFGSFDGDKITVGGGSSKEKPDDIRFRDKDGNVIATFYTEEFEDDVYLPISSLGRNINLNKLLAEKLIGLKDLDAIGVGGDFDFTFVMGGGKSIEAVYFLAGKDKGTWQNFTAKRQNVGANGSMGVYAIFADYHLNDSQLTAEQYEGNSFSMSLGVKGPWMGSYSEFWVPTSYKSDRSGFKSLFNTNQRLWSGYTVGGGIGAGFQWSRQFTSAHN